MEFKTRGGSSTRISTGPESIELNVLPIDKNETVNTPDKGDVLYRFDVNAPEISLIDYMKGIMNIMGWYAEPMEGDSGIKMLPYSTIADNKNKAIDWSNKLLNRRIEPSDIEFRMSDMAQKNYFRYSEDETVTGNYDGYLSVDDKTLEARKDIITVLFAASDMVGNVPSIPLYSFDDKGEMEIKDSIVPRILIQNSSSLTFEGLQWNKLLNENWGAYADIIRRPKIITEDVILNPIDLKYLDVTIPVYIEQFGGYFAILEVKTKDDDICTAKLLKL